ncbi:MAG: DNA repair protein RecN, partial [Christensenellales bacterium]
TNSDEEILRLERERDRLYSELFDAAKNLSEQRRTASRRLESEIMNELSELGMKGTTFCISFNEMPDRDNFVDSCNANGFDKVEFLISPNVGEPLKPLAKIVSGGEMSRFMLAVKHIIARIDEIGTLVFDEIDTGISGKIADVVSKKLYNISRLSQVIAVTHLPQLASFADLNILITKSVSDGRTHTTLKRLDCDGKITEISRLAGGVGEKGMLHAKEMIVYADNYKGLHK